MTKALLTAFLSLLFLAGVPIIATQIGDNNARPWSEVLEEYVGEPAYKSIDPEKPLDEQTSVFEIAGRTFEMPTVYIQTHLGDRRQIDGLNLLYVLPDYRSRAEFIDRRAYEQAREEQRFAHMLIQAGSRRPSLDRMVANRRHHMPRIDSAQSIWGLTAEHWYRPQGEKLAVTQEHYFERDADGHIVNWIECSTKENPSVRFPGCNHRFRDKGLLYNIYYNQANYLEWWREQRSLAIEFIDSFQIASVDVSDEGDVAEWPQVLKDDIGTRTYGRIDFSKPLSEQTETVRLGGRTFRIPIAYSPTDLAHSDPAAIVLNYVLPEYSSRASFSNTQQYQAARANGRFGQIMLRPAETTSTIDRIISQRRRNVPKTEQGEPVGDLESEDWYRLDKGDFILTTRVYLHRDKDGHITDLIFCGPFSHPYIKSKECGHKFLDQGFLYEMTYDMDRYLADWRNQRRSALGFIEGFSID